MAATVRLIATDLDGTLIGSVDELPAYGEFAARIGALRTANEARWVVLSGRSMRSFLEYFHPMRSLGILPDFVILKYTFIYRREGDGFRLCAGWSLHTLWQRLLRPLLTRRVIREWSESAVSEFRGTRALIKMPERVQLRFKSEESAASAIAALRAKLTGLDHVKATIEGTVVEARAFLYLKGLALNELERWLGVNPQEVLAIGNGHHDLSMMDESIACLTGCPANSHARVVDRVHQAGGHIAHQRSLAGVLEILDAYLNDKVDSSLPSSWRAPSGLRQSSSPASSRRRERRKRMLRFGALGVVIYAILMAFAVFEVIPYWWIIMKPYDFVVTLVSRLLNHI